MKSIGTDPAIHAGEGDERIRTAVPDAPTESSYEYVDRDRYDALMRLHVELQQNSARWREALVRLTDWSAGDTSPREIARCALRWPSS